MGDGGGKMGYVWLGAGGGGGGGAEGGGGGGGRGGGGGTILFSNVTTYKYTNQRAIQNCIRHCEEVAWLAALFLLLLNLFENVKTLVSLPLPLLCGGGRRFSEVLFDDSSHA